MHTSTDRVKSIHKKIPIAREGLPFILVPALVGIYLSALGFQVAALVFLLVAGFIAFFFRNPERVVPQEAGAVVSPADGRIVTVDMVDDPAGEFHGMRKISIFMSVFNVHVNRVPADATVAKISYRSGKFLSANLDKASADNERNTVFLNTHQNMHQGPQIVVVQVAGLIARRIVCKIEQGDQVHRGDRFGLIRFGSRLDVYLPAETTPAVSVGEKVMAGASRLGFIRL